MNMELKTGAWFIFKTTAGGYYIDHITFASNDYVAYNRYCCRFYEDRDPEEMGDFIGYMGATATREDYESILQFCTCITAEEAINQLRSEPIPEDLRERLTLENLIEYKE